MNGTAAITALLPKLRAFAQATVEPAAPFAFRGTARREPPRRAAVGAHGRRADRRRVGHGGLQLHVRRHAQRPGHRHGVREPAGHRRVGWRAAGATGASRATDRARRRLHRRRPGAARRRQHAGPDRPLPRFARPAPARGVRPARWATWSTVARAFGAVPEGTTATGAVEANWESRGGLANARSTITIANGTVTRGRAAAGRCAHGGRHVRRLDAGGRAVQRAVAGRPDCRHGHACPGSCSRPARAGRSPRPGRVDVKVTGLTEQALAPWLPAATLASMSGRVSATLGARPHRRPRSRACVGTLVLDEASAHRLGRAHLPVAARLLVDCRRRAELRRRRVQRRACRYRLAAPSASWAAPTLDVCDHRHAGTASAVGALAVDCSGRRRQTRSVDHRSRRRRPASPAGSTWRTPSS